MALAPLFVGSTAVVEAMQRAQRGACARQDNRGRLSSRLELLFPLPRHQRRRRLRSTICPTPTVRLTCPRPSRLPGACCTITGRLPPIFTPPKFNVSKFNVTDTRPLNMWWHSSVLHKRAVATATFPNQSTGATGKRAHGAAPEAVEYREKGKLGGVGQRD